MQKIGIIVALEKEVSSIAAEIEDVKIETIAKMTYFSGRIGDNEVIVAQSGMGKVSAAVCAQTMIFRFEPDFIINTGIGGALLDEMKIGDIAISDYTVEHDIDTTAIGDEYGYLSGLDIIKIPASVKLAEIFREEVKKHTDANVFVGTIASGDQFISSKERKDFIKNTFGAICCEMEGAAIGHVCYQNEKPFCVIRCISDNADDDAEMDYPTFATEVAKKNADIIVNLVKGV